MKTYRIYKIENTVNSLLYVGYTRQVLERRMIQHIQAAGSTVPRNLRNPLYIAMREYGAENFHIRLLEEGIYDDEKFRELNPILGRERYWMGKLNTFYPNGYNKHSHSLDDTDVSVIRFNAYNTTGAQYARMYRMHVVSVYNIQSNKIGRMYDHVTEEHLPVDILAYAKEMMHTDVVETRGQKAGRAMHERKKADSHG